MFVLRAVLKFTNSRENLTIYIFVVLLIFNQYRKSYSRYVLVYVYYLYFSTYIHL